MVNFVTPWWAISSRSTLNVCLNNYVTLISVQERTTSTTNVNILTTTRSEEKGYRFQVQELSAFRIRPSHVINVGWWLKVISGRGYRLWQLTVRAAWLVRRTKPSMLLRRKTENTRGWLNLMHSMWVEFCANTNFLQFYSNLFNREHRIVPSTIDMEALQQVLNCYLNGKWLRDFGGNIICLNFRCECKMWSL